MIIRRRWLLAASAAALCLGAAVAPRVSYAQQGAPTDTGSMTYPQPLASGEHLQSAPTGTDTGGMAYPSTQGQTSLSSENSRIDTGSMAYPAPRGAGNIQPNTTN